MNPHVSDPTIAAAQVNHIVRCHEIVACPPDLDRPVVTPEPGAMALVLLALCGVVVRRLRK